MKFTVPLSILVGFGMIAGVIYFNGQTAAMAQPDQQVAAAGNDTVAVGSTEPTRAEARLLYGNPEAETTIVEFSDFECTFCSRLHPTLKRIVDESDGSVNWEYRHLPLPSHQTAAAAALVGECVNKLGSNELFWAYADEIFSNDDPRSVAYYLGIGTSLGIEKDALETCADTEEVREIVQNDMSTARALGGSGTPFSVIVFADGTQTPISGAVPYEQWATALNL